MPVPQVALLSNPKSTWNKTCFGRIVDVAQSASNVFHFELGDITDVAEALQQFSRTRPAMIVVNGGDGTLQAVLTELGNNNPFKDATPPIAVLPSGKTNMVAADFDCRGKPEDVLRRLIQLAQSGNLDQCLVRRHVMAVDMGDGKPRRFGMFLGTAAIVRGIIYCNKHIYRMNLPNFLSHGISVVALCFSAFTGARGENSPAYSEPVTINLTGGGIIQGRFFAIVATTLDRLLFGTRPYGQEGFGSIGFSAVDHRPGAIINAVRSAFTKSFGRKTVSGINVRRINKFRLMGNEPITLDGEFYFPTPGQPVIVDGEMALDFVSLRPPA